MIFAQEDKPKTVDDIDRLVSAQIPDPELYPELHSTIAKHMMHGPCGDPNPDSPCMEAKPDGNPGEQHCGKKYPREFLAATDMSGDGYPRYARYVVCLLLLCNVLLAILHAHHVVSEKPILMTASYKHFAVYCLLLKTICTDS